MIGLDEDKLDEAYVEKNRDGKVTQLKLDELIRGVERARTGLVGLEHLDDEELDELAKQFDALRANRCPSPASELALVVDRLEGG